MMMKIILILMLSLVPQITEGKKYFCKNGKVTKITINPMNPHVELLSPGFPKKNYPNRLKCNFQIKVHSSIYANGQSLKFKCSHFQISGSRSKKKCKGDKFVYKYFQQKNGSKEKKRMVKKYCGSKEKPDFKIKKQNNFAVLFKTNKNKTAKGFRCIIDSPKFTKKEKCNCGQKNMKKEPRNRIVGGVETQVNGYPWHVGVVNEGVFGPKPYCGAVIISETHVLSAVHCLVAANDSANNYKIRIADHDLSTKDKFSFNMDVKKIDFPSVALNSKEDFYSHDLVIYTLRKPINFESKLANPICLPMDLSETYENYMGIVTGWGLTKENGTNSPVLLKAEVPIISNDECLNIGPKYQNFITDKMLCAGYLQEGGIDACQGDSGGPFVTTLDKGKNYELAGIVSVGDGCARPRSPGIYMRVTAHMDWIRSIIGNKSSCPRK